MPLRPPPRAPPFVDYDELIADFSSQFNVLAPDGTPMVPPEAAKAEWSESEIQFWFASAGAIEPSPDPKMRAASAALNAKAAAAIKSPAQIEAEQRVKEAGEAAKKAPYFKLLTEKDIMKAKIYREAAITTGHPPRPVPASDLIPIDDPWLRELERTKHQMPFLKHILQWDDKDESKRKAIHGEEGFTHGASAALRGFDMRFYWDASNLKLVGAVRYSQAATIAWQPPGGAEYTHQLDGTQTWMLGQIHGGCIEAVLDELTAEVMKINVAPDNSTAEITFKIKMPSVPGVTYKLEAEITECVPPRCMVTGRILTLDGQLVAEANAKMAMMDRLRGDEPQVFQPFPICPAEIANERSLFTVYKKGGGGGGGGAVDVSDGGGGGGSASETMAELKRLQKKLVAMMQNEYFCDDVEPPTEAFGWDEAKLRDYFENGGE